MFLGIRFLPFCMATLFQAFLWAAASCFAQAQESPVPIFRGQVTLAIGDAFGAEEYGFGKVSSVVGTGGARIVVADVQSSEIRVFGPDGVYQFTAARAGAGPSEVLNPCCLAFSPDGLLWIRDTGNARYVVLEVGASEARAVRTVRMAHAHAGRWEATSFSGDTLIDVGAEVLRGIGPAVRRFLVTPDGKVDRVERGNQPSIAELGHMQVGTSFALLYITPPFGARYLTAHGPGGVWAEAVTRHPEVTLHDRNGRITTVNTGLTRGPPLSTAERREAEEHIARQRRRARDQAHRVDLDVPDRKQPIETLFFDDSGHLWVQRSTADGQDQWADVYDDVGRLIERRTWPAGITIGLLGWAGSSWSLGVRQVEYDVEQVVRVDWTQGAQEGF